VGAIQAWFPEGISPVGLAAFLAAMVLSFLAGYLAGRSARPSPARRPDHWHSPAPAASRDGGSLRPQPVLDSDEARLMDLTAIRTLEVEPPAPIELAPRAPEAPALGEPTGPSADQLRLPIAGRRPGSIPRQRSIHRPDKKPS
jgi:hypothetical protein